MYTALDHSSIILAVKWLLKHHLRRRKGIWIPKDATIQPSFSNKPIDPTSGYFFPRDMILAVVVFDLDNIFFTCRSTLLRQTSGIAMGSPLSPALAILTCAYDEFTFHNWMISRHPSVTPNFFAIRYMDDLLAFVLDKRAPTAHGPCAKHPNDECANLHPRFHDLFHFYHKNLTMEIEPHTGTFKFLESMITVANNKISSQFFLKNYDKTQRRIVKRILNTQHWNSFTNSAVKQALVTGTLFRILRFTDKNPTLIIAVIVHWADELKSHEYPAHTILRPIRNLDDDLISRQLKSTLIATITEIFRNNNFDFTKYALAYC